MMAIPAEDILKTLLPETCRGAQMKCGRALENYSARPYLRFSQSVVPEPW